MSVVDVHVSRCHSSALPRVVVLCKCHATCHLLAAGVTYYKGEGGRFWKACFWGWTGHLVASDSACLPAL